MIRFDLTPERLHRYRIGPLKPHIEGFKALLVQHGYCFQIGRRKIRLAASLSQWLQQKQITLEQLEEQHVQAFLRARQKRISCRGGDQRTMKALLQHLRESDAISTPTPVPTTETEVLEEEYADFLTKERALARNSVNNHLRVACRLLSRCSGDGKVQLKKLQAKDITGFLLQDISRRGRRDAHVTTAGLRSFLRFLFQQGRITTNLAAAVPTVAGSPRSQLPRFLEAKQVQQVLRTCDRRTKVGKRDYAILLLLARLGLRAGEVIKMSLDDIDWHAGELLIRGKGGRQDKLPLLQDVGQALVAYLEKARPRCASRSVFIRHLAPAVAFSDPSTVGGIVRNALNRAGIQSVHRGAHVLRHSLATTMLNRGASLAQIGQVLRHRYVGSTEIYAKVNLNALRRLAVSWPGGVQ